MPLDLISGFKERLNNFPNTMYRNLSDPKEKGLRTGDVVFLEIADFKKILRNFSSFEPLLKQYETNEKYKSKFWAILNKPCDMVHDGSKRRFDTNLFLCPLQSFLTGFNSKEYLSKYKSQPASVEEYSIVLEKLLKSHLQDLASQKFKITKAHQKNEVLELKAAQVEMVETIMGSVRDTKILSSIKIYEDPDIVSAGLEEYARQNNLVSEASTFFITIGSMSEWQDYKRSREIVAGNRIVVSDESSKREDMSRFFRNQKDNEGLYYFEPNINLFSEKAKDFSYFLEIEDMLTLKISEHSIADGSFVDLLKSHRKVGLQRNFSDRLQNIMGNYFSKIGTADVTSNDIYSVYKESCRNFDY